MKDILDKIKKVYEEKVAPFLKEHKRYVGTAGLFVVFVVVLIFFAGPEFNAERIAKLNSIEVSGEDYVPDAKFEVDAYPELNALIEAYFDAYVVADLPTLESLVTPLTDMEKSYITAMSQFYEEYRNIKCYTKHGLSKDSYIVSACFDIKFTNQEVTAPSMVLFYVQTDDNGELYINNLYSDFNMKYTELAINKNVFTALRKYTMQDDYLELFNQVEGAFSKLIKENNEIYQLTKRTIPGTRQTWEDTVYYVESTEDLESTEGTETQGTENQTESESESEQVVEKIKIVNAGTMNVRIRNGAGQNHDQVGNAHTGDKFVKLGEETGTDGMKWIKIQYNDSTVGYVRSDFTELVTE